MKLKKRCSFIFDWKKIFFIVIQKSTQILNEGSIKPKSFTFFLIVIQKLYFYDILKYNLNFLNLYEFVIFFQKWKKLTFL